ncbi:MAG TPA: pitrilysin family protein [Gemmatimonadales bacterium]|nr:pitrilysin family protein [Gemmatimonadales bacterium]
MRSAPVRVLTLLALLPAPTLAPAVLHAQAAPAGRIVFEQFALPNGLQVVYSEDHSTPIVSVDVWYDVGSHNERAGRSGFAHLFEHMMFQGSAHVKKAEHFQLVQRAGGSMNGSTQEDRTNYFETLPSNRLSLALWLEADRMRSLAITQENFANQRETVKEERRLGVDNRPYGAAFTDGITWPFDSTACFAYAHTVIGSMTDLNAAQLPDVQAFFDTYYAPNNATLVVVGDFNPTELRQLVNQYFAGVPSHAAPEPVRCDARPPQAGAQRREVRDPQANLDAVLRFYRVPEHRHADTPALEVLNLILGQGESSRLNVAVVRREKVAVSTGSFLNPNGARNGPGVFMAFGIVNQGIPVDRMDSVIGIQLDSIRANGITPDELAKAKNILRASFISNRETTLGKAEELHHYRMFHNSIDEINTDLDRILAVTSEDVKRVANTYLAPANLTLVIVRAGPVPASGGPQ